MKSCDELFKSYCDNQNEAEMLFVFMICIEHVECKYCQSIFELRYEKKTPFCICENKDADQQHSNCAADQRLCFRYTDSTISLLPKSENPSP